MLTEQLIQAGLLEKGFGQGIAGQQQALQNLTGMASLVPIYNKDFGQQFGAMGTHGKSICSSITKSTRCF
jgi:hypothetical protein